MCKKIIISHEFMRVIYSIFLLLYCLLLGGCFLTKVVTVPMRVGGAVISVIPGVGNSVDDAVDTTADVIDKAPL